MRCWRNGTHERKKTSGTIDTFDNYIYGTFDIYFESPQNYYRIFANLVFLALSVFNRMRHSICVEYSDEWN